MTDYTWVKGDGIQISITIGDTHAVDGDGIHNVAFGPDAAEDPGTGIHVRTDGKIAIGHQGCPAIAFSRVEARVRLLHWLLDGVELSDAKGDSIYRAVGTAKGRRNGTIIVRPSDLFWRTGSSDQWADFPSLLEERYDLTRSTAWRMAWALVRTSYAGRWGTVETLLRHAALAVAQPSQKPVESAPATASAMFIAVMEAAIADLKRQVLP